jgi:curli production assembly/transport component CsgF
MGGLEQSLDATTDQGPLTLTSPSSEPYCQAVTEITRMRYVLLCTVALLLALSAPEAAAQQMVYQPRNPAFGGVSLNYQWQLSSAQAQNDFEQQRSTSFTRDPLQDFQQGLQRQLLSQLSRELIGNRFRNLDLTQQGTFDLGDFLIDVVPGLNGVTIRVFNVLTGDESVITIPGF